MNAENTTPEAGNTSSLKRQLIVCFVAMLLFAFIIFVAGPVVKQKWGEQSFNVFYMVSRLLGFLLMGLFLKGWAGRNRIQTLTSVVAVGFFDQVILKAFLTRIDMKTNPELWKDIPWVSDPVNLLYGLTQGFLYFVPILLILGFFGMEIARFVFRPKSVATPLL